MLETSVSHFLEDEAKLSHNELYEWLGFDCVTVFVKPAQLRDLHAKIGARLAEIDAQQPVVDIEGEIECPF